MAAQRAEVVGGKAKAEAADGGIGQAPPPPIGPGGAGVVVFGVQLLIDCLLYTSCILYLWTDDAPAPLFEAKYFVQFSQTFKNIL